MTMIVWLTNDGTEECIVAATSKRAAAVAMGRSLYSFNQFASDLRPDHPFAAVALRMPGVMLCRTNRKHHPDPEAEWKPR